MNKLYFCLLTILLLLLFANFIKIPDPEDKWERPKIEFPPDNPFSEASLNLGSSLFFETLLSKDTSISCQSCHMLDVAFADNLPVGEGILGRKVTRNSPTIFNVAFHPYFMMDGKFKTLEDQILGPINDHREFDMNPDLLVERLRNIPAYNEMSSAAYGEEITIEIIQKSIANFERMIISDNSKFDQFKRGEIELSDQETVGLELFNSDELNCQKCHNGYNFTNYTFENNGLYEVYQDSGRAMVTNQMQDLAKFKVPTLRNISLTFPYMHNGSHSSLEEVIDHYAAGGKKHSSQSDFIQGFEISQKEKKALIAFLATLTEERLLNQD